MTVWVEFCTTTHLRRLPSGRGRLVSCHRDPSALVRTCIRHVKEQAGLDLSRCTRWLRFFDVLYLRSLTRGFKEPPAAAEQGLGSADGDGSGGGGVPAAGDAAVPLPRYDLGLAAGAPQPDETVVYFVCDVDACVPSAEEWPGVWAERKAWRAAKAEREREQAAASSAAEEKKQAAEKVEGWQGCKGSKPKRRS